MKEQQNLDAFRSGKVSTAVLKNAIPAMVAMLMVLVYNVADTFLLDRQRMHFRLQQFPCVHQFFCFLCQWGRFLDWVEHL